MDIAYNGGGWRRPYKRVNQALIAGLRFPVDIAVSYNNGVGFSSERERQRKKVGPRGGLT